jgi:hypothetical protein
MSKKIRKVHDIFRNADSGRAAISVINSDSIATAVSCPSGSTIVVLNFANNDKPGGGYGNRGHTQEEYLMRDTNLGDLLDPAAYPICESPSDTAAIITKDVSTLDGSTRFIVITCPALAGPRVRDDLRNIDISYYMYDEDRINTEARIKLICAIAARVQVDTLILGAWGCGVFCNPVYEVCCMWKKYIKVYDIPRAVFPIPGEHSPLRDLFKKFLTTQSNL